MKKNTKKVATMLLVGVVAVGSYFVSGTYAKYTSEFSGYDDVNVAKWSWTINNTDINTYADSIKQNAYTFNLLETVKDSDGSSTESDVDTDLIAPGMTGEFNIEIKNKSEVNATYAISFVEAQTGVPAGIDRIPIEYSTDGGSTWVTNIASAPVAATNIAMKTGTATKTVKWRWAYQVQDANSDPATYGGRDAVDTQIGFAANSATVPNVKVTATVTVTQVD